MARILVTGAAGFIGAHVVAALARDGHAVVGCDNFNPYYSVSLKRERVAALVNSAGVECDLVDLARPGAAAGLLRRHGSFDTVVHLAGQAGVRHSTQAPGAHVQANVAAFVELLEACRGGAAGHVVYASSSSVYGARHDAPFRETDRCEAPASVYAATKLAMEAMAQAYGSLHALPLTGLRFFTVYGPWGRPDMAVFAFAQRIRRGEPIELYDEGRMQRDFSCIEDTVEAVRRIVARGPQPGPAEVFNVGHRDPVPVWRFLHALEQALGRPARIDHRRAPPGDVPVTCADPSRLEAAIGAWDWTPLDTGLERFVAWLRAWDPDARRVAAPQAAAGVVARAA